MKIKLNNGIHDIANEVYHDSEGLSRSGLWEFKRSPWHYWNKYLNPDAIKQKPTKDMKLGELVHGLVLEPNRFDERYVVEPAQIVLPKVELLRDVGRETFDQQKKALDITKKANDAIMNQFLANAEGKEIITAEQFLEAKAMSESVLRDDTAQSLFRDIKTENSIYFTHESTGLQCKVRPDAWVGSVVTDLKTAKDASYRVFQNAAFSSGYFLQAGMIKVALASIGITLEKFVFYCVEKTPGYPCVYYVLDDEALDYGVNQFNTLMEQFAHCLEQNEWSSYESQILYLPNYAQYEA